MPDALAGPRNKEMCRERGLPLRKAWHTQTAESIAAGKHLECLNTGFNYKSCMSGREYGS